MTKARRDLVYTGADIDAGRWQGHATEGHPSLITRELLDWKIHVPVERFFSPSQPGIGGDLLDTLADETGCNREWADEHFEERVGGVPLNPDPSHERWPWWKGQESSKQAGEQFTHTYSERFWPRWSPGVKPDGIRYQYGDLNDLINQLVREPMGRQAVLPIFFPEDTGAIHQGRVPCTLHYAFMQRNGYLHMWYPIRSCDFVRHMADDLYLAARLMLWVLNECHIRASAISVEDNPWSDVRPGTLHWTAYSLHYHKGDEHHVRAAQS
jgi:hypothetical protein